MLIGIDHAILAFINDTDGIRGEGAAAQAPHRTVDGLGAVQLPHPGEIDLHKLRLQPYRLPVQRHGLPYIHLLRQPGEREEVHGERKTMGIAGLVEEYLGLGGIVPVQLLEALIPVSVPDPRPELTVQLRVVRSYSRRLRPPE